MKVPRLIVAGASSGIGKTSVAVGLIRAFRARGLKVQPFKVGPDYLDPTYHTLASGLPCRNLDSWMLSKGAMKALFRRAAFNADLSLIEGVMGLYDGRGGEGEVGSTAEVAKLLKAPVLLVLDVGKLSRSAAAMALGYKAYDPDLPLAGFILNQVGSERHLRWVREAIEEATRLPVLGYLPKAMAAELPKRHLGLVPAGEAPELARSLEHIRLQVEATFDLEAILSVAREAHPLIGAEEEGIFPEREPKARVTIAIAQDPAFGFYYQDNLDLLEAWGAKLHAVSPLKDRTLPEDVQGLYLGGGFPELYAEPLEANEAFRQSVREAALAGMPIYAECGGLMYLSEGIVTFEGRRHHMVGLIPGWSAMQRRKAKMGYVVAEALRSAILLKQGQKVRAHEFHWSELPGPKEEAAYRILEPEGRLEGFVAGRQGNILGSYLHLHFGSDPALAQQFVLACARWRG